MDDNFNKQIKEWQESTKKLSDNLSNFVDTFMNDFTPEERQKFDEELKKYDISDLKKEIEKYKDKIKDL
jgi:hypothetical protein